MYVYSFGRGHSKKKFVGENFDSQRLEILWYCIRMFEAGFRLGFVKRCPAQRACSACLNKKDIVDLIFSNVIMRCGEIILLVVPDASSHAALSSQF